MLLLNRNVNEVIRIGDAISITVVKVHGNQVKLGFTVPKEIPIYREEVYQRILHENNSQTILGQRNSNTIEAQ